MSESGKLRLVRCPKCQNLLPELADYSVYQCGGCGAVLRAKNKPQETDCLSENNEEERAGGGSSKPTNLMEEGQVHVSEASVADVALNADHLGRDQRGLEGDDVGYAERNGDHSEMQATDNGVDMNVNKDEASHLKGREQEDSVSQIGYASGSHRSGKMSNWRIGERGKMEELRRNPRSHTSNYMDEEGQVHVSEASVADVALNADHLGRDQRGLEGDDVGYTERNGDQSEMQATDNGEDMNVNKDEVSHLKGREQEESVSQIGYASGSHRSGKMSNWRTGERGKMEELRRIPRSHTSNYMAEGPSNHHAKSSYSFGEPVWTRNDPDGVQRVKYLEQDRVELLRKLDELKDQLSRSCDLGDKPKEKVPLDRRMVPPDPYGNSDTWLPDGSFGSNRASMQLLGPDKHVPGPSYFNHCPEQFPYSNRHERAMHGVYPSMHSSNHMPGNGDPFAPQMLMRAPHQLHGHYQQQSSHPYFSGQYMDPNPASFEPYPHNKIFHQPSCSCIQCYNKHHQPSLPVPPAAFSHKRFPDMQQSNSMLCHNDNFTAFGSHIHNSRASIPSQLTSRNPQINTRWPSDVNSEMGGYVHYRPQRVVLASGGRRCRPIAGGAPFITCNNCFELLQLPKKVLRMVKKQQKIQCGTCSTVMNFAVVNNKLLVSVHTETKKSPVKVDDYSDGMVNNGTSYSRDPIKRTNITFSSDDFDNSGYEFQSLDREPPSLSTGKVSNSSNPQEMQSFHSSSPSISEDENSPDSLVAAVEGAHSVQQSINAARSPPPPGSPLQEHFEFSSNNHSVNRFGKGNHSSRSDHEKVMPNKKATRQNSLKEESLATEMEVSFNEYSNTGISQDSRDSSREEDRPRTNKGGESFFTNIIKKSFRDFTRSSQTGEHGKCNVSVNGHPMSDRLVKKAEKLAGPIQPGEYWYDSRAGFWGIMGGPCLGIILPFIEELNYPIPENCAGGTTGVFVNGRELHQKDLELLASRGLPTTRDRSYIVEISGRVLDEDTGEELDSLGRLAPTVEKVKHGFGMKPPKAVVGAAERI